MNRKYTIEEFEKGVKLLRNKFPNVALTTDIIVGFPGETDEEFDITYKFLSGIKFSKMHVFKYSQRKGTVAAKMKDQIDPKYIGKTLEVLFETKVQDEYTEGHTTNYICVKAKGAGLENTIQNVKILKRENLELIGKIE